MIRFYSWFILFLGTNGAFAQIQQKELEKNYEKALKYFEKGKISDGFASLDRCLSIDSTWRDAWYAKGFFALEEQMYTEAIHFFSKSIQISPSDTLAYLGRAKSFVEIGDYPQAFRDIQVVLEKDSLHLQALMDMAYTYATVGYPEQAQSYLDKALRISPQNADIWQLKAYTYWLDKNWQKTDLYNNKVLAAKPKNIESLKIKAYNLFDRKNYVASAQTFEQIAAIDKYAFEEEDLFQWGMALFQLKEYAKALQLFSSYPTTQNTELLYGQALCYIQGKEMQKAWDILEKLEKEAPDLSAEFYYNKAFVAWQLKQPKRSVELYKNALSLMPELYEHTSPGNVDLLLIARTNDLLKNELSETEVKQILLEAYQQRSLAFWEEEAYIEAKNDLSKAFALDSLSAKNYSLQALMAFSEGTKNAEKYFDKAEQLCQNTEQKEWLYWLKTIVATETENYGQALFFLEKAAQLNPQEANYEAEKARLFYQTEEGEKALQSIEKALLLDKENVDYQLDKLKILYADNKMVSLLEASQSVLRKNPNALEAYFFRGVALLADGQKEQAKKDLVYYLLFYTDDKETQELVKSIP